MNNGSFDGSSAASEDYGDPDRTRGGLLLTIAKLEMVGLWKGFWNLPTTCLPEILKLFQGVSSNDGAALTAIQDTEAR